MKKLGLFTNLQYDEPMFNFYRQLINGASLSRTKDTPHIEVINLIPCDIYFDGKDYYASTGLFESYFHTAIEYATNVVQCKVLAVAMYDSFTHCIAEETFADIIDDPSIKFVSAVDCAIVAARAKKFKRLSLVGMNFSEKDTATRERFLENSYEIVDLFDWESIRDLCVCAGSHINKNYEFKIDAEAIEALRHVCGTIESAAKAAKVDALIVGGPELSITLDAGKVQIPRINFTEEHIRGITEALLI